MKPQSDPPAEAALRQQAEARLREQEAATCHPPSEADNHRLLHKLQVHQVELELQNHALLELREQLERSLAQYTDLYNFAPVGYFTLASDGAIRTVNLAGAALLGVERAHLIERRLGIFVAAADQPTFNAFLERMLARTTQEHCEITLTREGAPPRYLRLDGVAARSGADWVCQVVAVDISERKRAEAAIRASENSLRKMMEELRDEKERFAKVVATVPGVICSFRLRPDGSACFPYASPAINDLYGLRPEELAESAAPLWAMIHPDDLGHLDAGIIASARTMTPWRDEFRLRHPSKGEIWVEGHSMPVHEPDGGILWHGFVQDITARKRAEEALRESAAIYRAIGESIDYGVWICAPDGRNIYASDSFLKLVGLTQEQCSNFGWGDVLHPDDAERTIAAWKECIRTGGIWDIEHRFRRVDGQYHAILARGVPVKNARGEIVCWAGINLDISRLKQTEEALRHLLEEKETLLREVHHRVKNNLAAIIDLLELQREDMMEGAAYQLEELGNRIHSMFLVHKMLYQSQNLHRIDFQAYLQTLATRLHYAFDPQGTIHFKVAATDVYLDLDTAIPCGLIVNELVINALKYAFPRHRPWLGASAREIAVTADWDGATYTLRVADNGVGLPSDLDWTTTRTLGLRLVRMLGQHQLGGQLELNGAPGTCFSLRFGSRQPKGIDPHDRQNYPDR
ncbi:MAG: PAS domain S-box protein [Candidatus Contendobacter sp.]|nr:PAS domain S-box protein [Candidatus Contendobacter sp.]MDS4057621.1 PAS domain S-box protein [Candidatus Contendobacter sp.]